MTRIKRDMIASLAISVFCIIMLIWAIPAYTPAYPGYGASAALVPNVCVSVMLFMACLSLLRYGIALFIKKPMSVAESEFPEDLAEGAGFTQIGRVKLRHLASTIVPCILLVIAIEYIPYVFVSFVFLMIFQYVIGSRNWLQSTIVSVLLTTVLYIVMRYGFGVPVPGPQLF